MRTLPHSVPLNLQQATDDPRLHQRLLDTNSQASVGQSFVGSLLLSPGSWCAPGFVCALQESVSLVLCKFWWLCSGIKGDLLQEGLCHTQVCCTQSPCPHGRPLLNHTAAGDTQTFKGRSGSVSVGSPDAQGFVWSPQTSLVGMGFDSKCNFAPPIVLLGLLLCPWT